MRLMQQDVVSFVLFLHRVVHPKLARDFMQLPDQINRANAFYTVSLLHLGAHRCNTLNQTLRAQHNTKTPENRPFIQALSVVARARGSPEGAYPASR